MAAFEAWLVLLVVNVVGELNGKEHLRHRAVSLRQHGFLVLTCPFFDAPSGGTPIDIDVIYTPLESAFNGLQFRRWHYGSIFIRLAVVASQSRQIA